MGFLFSKARPINETKFEYGNAVFTVQPEDYRKIENIDSSNFNMLFGLEWSLEYLQFQKDNWTQVFSLMNQTSVEALALYKSGSTNILKQISQIKFTHLQILALGQNKISNIQSLAFIDIKHLRKLRLNDNQITCTTPLNKLNCLKLSRLNLNDNPIKSLSEMHRIRMNHQNQSLGEEKQKSQFSLYPNHDQCIYNLAKFQLRKTSRIYLGESLMQVKFYSLFKIL